MVRLDYLESLLQEPQNNIDIDYIKYILSIYKCVDVPVDNQFFLSFFKNKLSIQLLDSKDNPLNIDLLDKQLETRLEKSGNGEMIVRGCFHKNKLKKNHIILDATAGLASDSMVLASQGASIIMLERSPVVSSLLVDALRRFYLEKGIDCFSHNFVQNGQDKLHKINNELWNKLNYKLQLLHSCSLLSASTTMLDYINKLDIDTIYLDPMYPHKDKNSLVKKRMQYLQKIIGADNDSDELLDVAMKINCKRVVVKRPKTAHYLNNIKPSYIISSKANRLDIYQK